MKAVEAAILTLSISRNISQDMFWWDKRGIKVARCVFDENNNGSQIIFSTNNEKKTCATQGIFVSFDSIEEVTCILEKLCQEYSNVTTPFTGSNRV